MTVPLQVTFQGLPTSAALEADVARRLDKLTRFNSRISACRVTVTGEGLKPDRIAVSVQITVPNEEVIVTRRHEDAMQACAEAFDAAKRGVRQANEKLHG